MPFPRADEVPADEMLKQHHGKPLAAVPPRFSSIGKTRKARPAIDRSAEMIEDFGAGEGIRTLDPNLGKVVLYP
jgi:hypothetical protein